MSWGWLRLPGARRVALAAALAVAAAYQASPKVTIDLGSGILGSLAARDLYDTEADYRWTRAISGVVVPDPGPGLRVRVEADVVGWRPRGQKPPRLVLEAAGTARHAQPSSAGETVSLETATSGWWDSDLEVVFRSETFAPGGQDPRLLGVRVYRVRLVPLGARLALRRPPLRQVVLGAAALVLIFGLLLRMCRDEPRAQRLSLAIAAAVGLAYAFARPYAAALSWPAVLLLALVTAIVELAPGSVATAAELGTAIARCGWRGLRLVARPPAAGLVLAGALAVTLSYRVRPSLEIDLGTGREALFERGLASVESAEGVTFRHAVRGAQLDLRDLGGGTEWAIDVTASAAKGASQPVVRAGTAEARSSPGPGWTTERVSARAPWGWNAGLLLEFPAATPAADLRIDKVRIDRGRALPSLRALSILVGTPLLGVVLAGAAGAGSLGGFALGGSLLAAETAALLFDPVLAVPFALPFLAFLALGAIFAAVWSALCAVAARRGFDVVLPAPAIAAASLGFALWLSAAACPLYRGGNFLFHSAVAEEIWKGSFWKYYLPYPGSMLSRQAQWGDVIVPHPCTYHIVVAPLAALPRFWFYLVEKGVLAAFLMIMALAAALLAARAGGPRAGVWAAIVATALVPGFLLLGLGHSMTLFGCMVMSVAFTYLTLGFDRLPERRAWRVAVLLMTFCFLSYFAALLFAGFALAVAIALLWRRHPGPARSLLSATIAAGILAFFVYYVYWVWPFLTNSVPQLLAQASPGGASPRSWHLGYNLARQPRKLVDTYGTPLLPLAGVAGLCLASRWVERVWLLAWGGVLLFFGGVDLFFNMLLKHHYFVMVPVSVGAGLLLASLSERSRGGRIVAGALLIYLAALGAGMALDVALGRVP